MLTEFLSRPLNSAPARRLDLPARLALLAAWVVLVALMLAAIAGVARAQVQKGQDLRFAGQVADQAPLASSDTTSLAQAGDYAH